MSIEVAEHIEPKLVGEYLGNSDLADKGRTRKDVPLVMQNPDEKHAAVWTPHVMPRNLLVFQRM